MYENEHLEFLSRKLILTLPWARWNKQGPGFKGSQSDSTRPHPGGHLSELRPTETCESTRIERKLDSVPPGLKTTPS